MSWIISANRRLGVEGTRRAAVKPLATTTDGAYAITLGIKMSEFRCDYFTGFCWELTLILRALQNEHAENTCEILNGTSRR